MIAIISRTVIAGIAVLVSGCALNPYAGIAIDSSVDPKTDFSEYRTYSWFSSASIVHDTFGRWEPPGFDADKEIRYLIDTELHKHDMTFADTDADVFVVYAAGVDMDALRSSIVTGDNLTVLDTVPTGALIVSLVDAETGEAIWASQAVADVKVDQTDQQVRKRLAHAVRGMFKDLPD